jgi:tetratricopeptide (TPR) repeat protein
MSRRSTMAFGSMAAILFALAAGRCSGPSEVPSPLFRWPEGWPLPSEAGCAPARGARQAERLAALDAALRSGRLREAEKRWADLARGTKAPAAELRLAGAEVALLRQEPAVAIERIGAPEAEDCWAVVLLRTEAHEASGDVESAWKSLRASASESPRLAAVRGRIEERRVEGLVAAARLEAAEGRGEEARRILSRLVVEHPRRAEGYLAFSETALLGKDVDGALASLRRGLDVVPDRGRLLEEIAKVASDAGRWQEALEAAEEIGKRDPARLDWVEGVRARWSAANAPEPVRKALDSGRLSRAELALLLWWLVPELRAVSLEEPPIATDVVDRPDKGYLIRALALGLWSVDPINHALHPDQAVGRRELGAILSKLATTLSPPDRGSPRTGEWLLPLSEGASERLDGRTAAAAIGRFRQDVLGRPR